MKKSLRIGAILLAVAMLFSVALTGCKSTTQNTSSMASTVKEPWDVTKTDTVTISVINNYYTAGEKQLAVDYMKLHPETKVVVDVVADGDSYTTKMKTTLTTDKSTAADIIHANFLPETFGISYEKGWLLDLSSMLDETNPYNGNKKTKDVFDDLVITRAISVSSGKMVFLPFDYCGIAFYYNKTIFDKYGLSTPKTFEDLISICQTLKDKGYAVPCVASGEANWVESYIGDVAYRSMLANDLIQPTDATYDASTMSQNSSIKYSATDNTFDLYAVYNDERIMAYLKKNGVDTDINKFVWSKFAMLAKYYQPNWTSPDSSAVITAFESQNSPIQISGSWNVGKFVSDIKQLPTEKQFDWGTFKIPNITDNQGYTAKMRSLYVFGNLMGIIPKDDADHEARVKDVLKYWYSPKVAQMMYDVTLSSGNLVQGPPAIKGVTLSAENSLRLNGFVSEGCVSMNVNRYIAPAILKSDAPIYNTILANFVSGSITVDSFLDQYNVLAMKNIDDAIKKNGYDLNPATKDTPQS